MIIKRLTRLSFVVLALFGLMLLRLFWVQIIQNNYYKARAAGQRTLHETLQARRGEILVHEKDQTISFATTKTGWLLAINPKLLGDPEKTYEVFKNATHADISKDEFMQKASKKQDPYEVILHRISRDAKSEIEAANLNGIIFEPEEWRFYPAGGLASHLIGFVGADGTGQYGLERTYNKALTGVNGVFEGEKTLGGQILAFGKSLLREEQNGNNIFITIDAGVQTHLEQIIAGAMKEYNAASAGGIVMDPRTGKILAMASVPSFDPNLYSKEKNIGIFQNPNTESLFEMGSVMKPLTMAAAFDVGAATPETTYFDEGNVVIDKQTISNYDRKGRGRIPMYEILAQSLNTGAVFLMNAMGKDVFRSYMYSYGFGKPTGVELNNEVAGNIKNLESTRTVEYATASFGQGIAVTPIEMTRALSSLANGGNLIHPYLVEEIRNGDGSVVKHEEKTPERVMKEETAKTVTRLLVEVVDKKLANGKGKIPGYSVAAKTGTAQIAQEDRRGYSDEFLHTFFGYGPAYDSKFFIYLYLEKPHGIRFASESLTEPFRSMIRFLFSYYEIPPDRPQELARP